MLLTALLPSSAAKYVVAATPPNPPTAAAARATASKPATLAPVDFFRCGGSAWGWPVMGGG